MRLNKFQVSTVLYFKSGNSKKVDWIEERLVKKVKVDEKEVTDSLTLDEADAFFQGKFKDWKDNGTTIVRKNAKGENSVIAFSEVEYITVSVTLVGEDIGATTGGRESCGTGNLPNTPAPPPPSSAVERQLKSITEHPAYKKQK